MDAVITILIVLIIIGLIVIRLMFSPQERILCIFSRLSPKAQKLIIIYAKKLAKYEAALRIGKDEIGWP